MPILICKGVTFYSIGDELRFFKWIESIKGVKRWQGVLDEVHIFVNSKLSDKSSHELWGLFQRYKINTKQLKDLKLVPSYWQNRKS